MLNLKSCKQILLGIRTNGSTLYSCVFLLQNPSFSSITKHSSSDPNAAVGIDFLVKSCGLSIDKAISASNKLKTISKTDKPQLVLDFLESNGFTKTQITKIVSVHPRLLLFDVEKTLEPKVKYFQQSLGVSKSDVADLMALRPHILFRSLEKEIIPGLEFVRRNVSTNENVLKVLKRCRTLSAGIEPNLDVLRALAVPETRISYLLMTQPAVLSLKLETFKNNVEAVVKMGFQPGSKNFTTALHAMSSMSKPTWDSKIKLVKDSGWSEDQIFEAFRRAPLFLTCSEEKMKRGLDLFMKKLKWDVDFLSKNPKFMLYSLDSRIIPRLIVCKILMSRLKVNLFTMLTMDEERFLKICREHDEHPDLLKIYKAKYTFKDAERLLQDWAEVQNSEVTSVTRS